MLSQPVNQRSAKSEPLASTRERAQTPTLAQSLVVGMARAILLGTMSYASWRFGATDTVSLLHISTALLVTVLLVAIAAVLLRFRIPTIPRIVFWVPVVFLGYALIQSGPIPEFANAYFGEITAVRSEFGSGPAAELFFAAQKLDSKIVQESDPSFFGSLIPQETRWAMVPFILATAVAWLSSVLFAARRPRTTFLWCLLIHTVLLATWGIVQRSTGSDDLLPGVPNIYRSIPFASFIYRNAGVAAILPGIAAAVALIYSNRSTSKSSERARPSVNYYSNRTVLSAKDLAIMSLAIVLAVGTAISLSRGAWISLSAALLLITVLLRKAVRWEFVLAILTITIAVGSVALYKVTKQLEFRFERLGYQELTLDERWTHWNDGIATAVKHFPSGSGLGTYGYATLLEQSEPRNGWFREAHNQYLEIATESGIVGVLLLVALIAWWLHACIELRPKRIVRSGQREHQSWGLFAISVFAFAAIQSFGDFVLTIPANMIIYASFFGILAQVKREHKDTNAPMISSRTQKLRTAGSSQTQKESPDAPKVSARNKLWTCVHYASVSGLIVIGLCAAAQLSKQQLVGDLALERTPLSELSESPSDSQIKDRMAILDEALRLQPDRAVLHRQRATWSLARYRSQIVESADEAGESVPWESTDPEQLYQVLASLPEQVRESTISALRSPELATPLADALVDLGFAIQANPVFVQAHLTAAFLATTIRVNPSPWVTRSARLSLAAPEKLFICGVLASTYEDESLARKCWRDCLTLSPKFAATIFPLALQNLSPLEVSQQFIPEARPEMQITLIRTVLTNVDDQNPQVVDDTKQLARNIVEELLADEKFHDASRHAIAANLFELTGESNLVAEHWVAAVNENPANIGYRLKAARALRVVGELEEALRHATLGKALANEATFETLTKQIRSDILKAKPISP